jgi:hypothetical protein
MNACACCLTSSTMVHVSDILLLHWSMLLKKTIFHWCSSFLTKGKGHHAARCHSEGNIGRAPYLKSGDDEPKADSQRVDLRRRRRGGAAWPRGRREAAAGGWTEDRGGGGLPRAGRRAKAPESGRTAAELGRVREFRVRSPDFCFVVVEGSFLFLKLVQ